MFAALQVFSINQLAPLSRGAPPQHTPFYRTWLISLRRSRSFHLSARYRYITVLRVGNLFCECGYCRKSNTYFCFRKEIIGYPTKLYPQPPLSRPPETAIFIPNLICLLITFSPQNYLSSPYPADKSSRSLILLIPLCNNLLYLMEQVSSTFFSRTRRITEGLVGRVRRCNHCSHQSK